MPNPNTTQVTVTLGERYKFLGRADTRFPKLKTGKIYRLMVIEQSWGLWDWIRGVKHPQIVLPFNCPYQSWKTFNQNWKKL